MEPVVPPKKLESGVFQGTPESETEKKDDTPQPRLIRTMKSDAEEAIKKQNETLVSIALAEEKKRVQEQKEALAAAKKSQDDNNSTPAPKRIGRMVVVVVIVLIFSALIMAYLFVLPRLRAVQVPSISLSSFIKPSTTATSAPAPVVEPLALSIIPAQSEKRFNISRETLSQMVTLMSSENTDLPAGSIKNMYISEDGDTAPVAVSVNRLLSFVGISTPEILTRSLEKSFMTGFLKEAGTQATPFLVLKVSSYDAGFAGMLDWEATLPQLFNSLFGTKIESGTTPIKFHDVLIRGKDARAFSTPFGAMLAYTFTNQNTIIITGSLSALETLIPLVPTPTSR